MVLFRIKGETPRKIRRILLTVIVCALLVAVLFELMLYPRIFSVMAARITTDVTSCVQNAVFSEMRHFALTKNDRWSIIK